MGWYDLLYLLLGLVIGAVATFFITRYFFQKQLKENPPMKNKLDKCLFQWGKNHRRLEFNKC